MAESAVKQAIPKLHALGVPTKRPEDYFAQMIKSDDHMRKVSTATSELSSTTLYGVTDVIQCIQKLQI